VCHRCRSCRHPSGGCSASQVRVRLLIGTLIVSVNAMRTAAATAAMAQSKRAVPAGATTAVIAINTEVSGSKAGITRPNVQSRHHASERAQHALLHLDLWYVVEPCDDRLQERP
jgi:hypothetical protein